jgi:hypothetical protein
LVKALVYQIARGDEADGEYGEFDARHVTIGIIDALNSQFNQDFSSKN